MIGGPLPISAECESRLNAWLIDSLGLGDRATKPVDDSSLWLQLIPKMPGPSFMRVISNDGRVVWWYGAVQGGMMNCVADERLGLAVCLAYWEFVRTYRLELDRNGRP